MMAKKRVMPMQPLEYDRLKASLENARKEYRRHKSFAQVDVLQAVRMFLQVHGIPKRLMAPVIDLERELLNSMPGGNKRETHEAFLLAKAQAAIDFGMRKDAYGSVTAAAAAVSNKVPHLGWSRSYLINHRKNHKRINPAAYEQYEYTLRSLDHFTEWEMSSNRQKADALIKSICDLS